VDKKNPKKPLGAEQRPALPMQEKISRIPGPELAAVVHGQALKSTRAA
jgi:hypothetical protein